MNVKDIELIRKMLKMQAKLDEAIMKEYGLICIYEENLSFAILDEVGELTHELKANWCWWKKTQPQVDEEKVLGELVDIWHFVLSWQNHFMRGEEGLRKEKVMDEFEKEFGFKLLPTGFKKPLSEITKEEYRERIEQLWKAIINDNSNEEDDF